MSKQFEPIAGADALAIIDSDPGGYIGSTDDEFVALVKGQVETFRSFHGDAGLFPGPPDTSGDSPDSSPVPGSVNSATQPSEVSSE